MPAQNQNSKSKKLSAQPVLQLPIPLQTQPTIQLPWNECPIGYHVSKELRRCTAELLTISQTLTEIRIELAKLKVKSGIWGAIGASIPLTFGFLLYITSMMLHQPITP